MVSLLLSTSILFAWIPICMLQLTRTCGDPRTICADVETQLPRGAEDQTLTIDCNESSYFIHFDTGHSSAVNFEHAMFNLTCGDECTSGRVYSMEGSFSGMHSPSSDVTSCEVMACFVVDDGLLRTYRFKSSSSCLLRAASPTTDSLVPPPTDPPTDRTPAIPTNSTLTSVEPDPTSDATTTLVDNDTVSPSTNTATTPPVDNDTTSPSAATSVDTAATTEGFDTALPSVDPTASPADITPASTTSADTTSDSSTSPPDTLVVIVAGTIVVVALLAVLVFVVLVIACVVYRRARIHHLQSMKYFETFDQLGDGNCTEQTHYRETKPFEGYHGGALKEANLKIIPPEPPIKIEELKLEVGSQMSVYYPLYHHTILTDGINDNNTSLSKVSTSSSDSLNTEDSTDNENEVNLNLILNSPSHSEASIRTDYASNILLDNVSLSSENKETASYVDSNFRKIDYTLDTSYVQSVETDNNLDLHQESEAEMKICSGDDDYLKQGTDELPVCSIPAQVSSQPTSADSDMNGIKFEFGDGSNSLTTESDFEFDPSSSNLAILDYQLTDEFDSEASERGYLPSMHKHFNTGHVDVSEDVVLHKTNISPPYLHSNSVTSHVSTTSTSDCSSTSFSSGYISSDASDINLKMVSNTPSDVDFFFLEEIPIFSTNH